MHITYVYACAVRVYVALHSSACGRGQVSAGAFDSLATTLPTSNCARSLYTLNCSVLLNKVQQFTLCDTDHAICVSYAWYETRRAPCCACTVFAPTYLTCSKDSLVLGASIQSEHISVIPNAIYADLFAPASHSSRHASDSDATVHNARRVPGIGARVHSLSPKH